MWIKGATGSDEDKVFQQQQLHHDYKCFLSVNQKNVSSLGGRTLRWLLFEIRISSLLGVNRKKYSDFKNCCKMKLCLGHLFSLALSPVKALLLNLNHSRSNANYSATRLIAMIVKAILRACRWRIWQKIYQKHGLLEGLETALYIYAKIIGHDVSHDKGHISTCWMTFQYC